MCYYYGQRVTREEFIRLRDLEKSFADLDFIQPTIFNGFQFPQITVLKPEGSDFIVTEMEWGLLPSNLKDEEDVRKFRNGYVKADGSWQTKYDTLNARSENLWLNKDGKPSMFRYAAMERRCLIPATEFYEWRHIYQLNKKTGLPKKTADKYPYRIFMPEDNIFYFLGIWNPWTDKTTGEYKETVSLVTTGTTENILMDQVHNEKHRMPSIKNAYDAYEWIFGTWNESGITEMARIQYPWQKMDTYSLAKKFMESDDPNQEFQYPLSELPKLVLPGIA